MWCFEISVELNSKNKKMNDKYFWVHETFQFTKFWFEKY